MISGWVKGVDKGGVEAGEVNIEPCREKLCCRYEIFFVHRSDNPTYGMSPQGLLPWTEWGET